MAELARHRGVDVATFEDRDPAGRRFVAVAVAEVYRRVDTGLPYPLPAAS